jgi:hypothetical protein
MRIGQLLASLADFDLERLAREHVHSQESLARPQVCNFLETTIRSYRFVNDFIINRQPPTFALLALLLDAPEHRLPAAGLPDFVMEETNRIAGLVGAGEILGRDDGLRLYRKVLYEARRNDLDVNSSEAALLAVLRREAGISQVEHFLIEHHPDLREFWERDGAFLHEQNALRSAGLIFAVEGHIVIADDVAPAVHQTLGIDMPRPSARRLYDYLSSADLANALEQAGARTSGSKEARVERLLTEWIQPRAVLAAVGIGTLKDICRASGAAITGNKEDLIERIIGHFSQGRDQEEEAPASIRVAEERALDEAAFTSLFSALTGQELTDILRRFPELKQSGAKTVKVATLWEAHLAERTLLGQLMNRDLEEVLQRMGLRMGGSKPERIERIIQDFSGSAAPGSIPPSSLSRSEQSPPEGAATDVKPIDAEISERQRLFREYSTDPQSRLLPWLEELLDAAGRIKCYATEVSNPTQQLKNKLAQAIAARGGLLVLMLADEDSYERARDALIERWGSNDEWMKSVACVALAYPSSDPAIACIVEWSDSPWPDRLRSKLFPAAMVRRAAGSRSASLRTPCATCRAPLPDHARFCPNCGTQAPVG